MTSTFTMLLDEQATRDGLIRAFRRTFADAGPGDTAVFYYSGHGSQQEAPPEHLVFEPDGLDETLVLHDSRADGGYDLADVELGALVREITARGAHVFVVLDCCHSGSGLREADGAVTGIRRAPTARGRRPAEQLPAGGGRCPTARAGCPLRRGGVRPAGGVPQRPDREGGPRRRRTVARRAVRCPRGGHDRIDGPDDLPAASAHGGRLCRRARQRPDPGPGVPSAVRRGPARARRDRRRPGAAPRCHARARRLAPRRGIPCTACRRCLSHSGPSWSRCTTSPRRSCL